jgi:phospholipid/cholesterol/gamma-HCH transport system ATP-binding protein
MLYDEPSTGIDPIRADAINDLVIRMKKELKVATLIITHDMVSAYKVADRIGMLYAGQIIEMGSPEEIKNSSNQVVQQFIHGRAEGPIKNW